MKYILRLLLLLAAIGFGYLIALIVDHSSPGYIGRDTAVAMARYDANYHCIHEAKDQRICSKLLLRAAEERPDGWYIYLYAADGHHCDTMYIGRRSEYQSLTRNWDNRKTGIRESTPCGP